MVDRGHGIPFVLIPGIQGRWEWMKPTVQALEAHGRVLTFSLCDEPTSGFPCTPARGLRNYLDQIDAALDRAGVREAIIVGVSYGGLAAFEYAATRPDRVRGLVLASALPPGWVPDRRARFYLRAPLALSPVFCVGAPTRLYRELRATYPQIGPRARFVARYSVEVLQAFLSPTRMARRVRWAEAHAFAGPSQIAAPVLIVTGERRLDRVVSVDLTERCARGLRHVQRAVLPDTGHLGIVTKPEAFAGLVAEFANRTCSAPVRPVRTSVR